MNRMISTTAVILGLACGTAAGPAHAQNTTRDAPPTAAYQGGIGSPASSNASNINSSDTRSEIGSRLPNPDAAANTPQAYLAAAQRALNQGRAGAAQEALERAETRVLSRTTDVSRANEPDQAAMVRNIAAARMALGRHDMAGAKAAVQMAMNNPVPPRGPAVTMVPVQPPPMPGVPARSY